MKALLVNTNLMRPPVAPVGLDYLADSIRAAGHEPMLLDLCFSADVKADIEAASRQGPHLIGCTVRNTDDCYFASGAFFLSGIRDIIASLRRCSGAPVVLGGVGFSVMPEAVVEFCGADYGIAGEGEEAIVRLLGALEKRSDPARLPDADRIPGLVFRSERGMRRSPAVDLDLEQLPSRTRSFLDNRRYFTEGGQAGFETRRGCPRSCIYCADPVAKGRRTRLLPPRRVVDELRALLGQGIDHLHTCDPEFNVPLAHAHDVCRAMIANGLGDRIRWFAYCSPAPFDEETAVLMRRAGCAGIDFGADSGNDRMLHRLGRQFRAADLETTARACRQAAIPFMYDLMLGGPDETVDSLRESLDLVRRIGPDCVGISLGVRVYEGTPLADEVRRTGPMETNPALRGERLGNGQFLRPVFYLSPGLGPDPAALVRDAVGDDPRFFLPGGREEARDYNYNDNEILERAIRDGARGAYWDILRRMRAV
ncbi:MAG: hypothetical protein A2177_11875 [Spirochaetes bacterium RBG_13_68_11]|nr:MAG: hypothetical protein A2177_11875 [Spirochaetes bacterium RBG_13_68_11]